MTFPPLMGRSRPRGWAATAVAVVATVTAVAVCLAAPAVSAPTRPTGGPNGGIPAALFATEPANAVWGTPPPSTTGAAGQAPPVSGAAVRGGEVVIPPPAAGGTPVPPSPPAAAAAATAACAASVAATGGLICEPPATWATRGAVHAAQAAHQVVPASDANPNEASWWLTNYEPTFSCAAERRLGRPGDGGKWVCDPGAIAAAAAAAGRPCVVYSFGSGGDSSFEAAVHAAAPACAIHTFDHTVGVATGAALPPYVHFHPWAAAGVDVAGTPRRGLGSIRRELGHPPRAGGGTSIDVLKMDIEGAEYDTLLPWLAAGDLDGVRQLLVEIHSPRRGDWYATTRRLFAALDAAGWVITHKEPNLGVCGRMQEYAFLKLDWSA